MKRGREQSEERYLSFFRCNAELNDAVFGGVATDSLYAVVNELCYCCRHTYCTLERVQVEDGRMHKRGSKRESKEIGRGGCSYLYSAVPDFNNMFLDGVISTTTSWVSLRVLSETNIKNILS